MGNRGKPKGGKSPPKVKPPKINMAESGPIVNEDDNDGQVESGKEDAEVCLSVHLL